MSKTREERRRRKRDILAGIAWMALCVAVICGAHWVTEYVIVDEPMGVYAEDRNGRELTHLREVGDAECRKI